GTIENVASAGSAENVARLAAAAHGCSVDFALAQDGSAWPAGLQLIARFAKPESVLFVGRKGDAIQGFADLRGLRIGVGPAGSGTDVVARQIFALPDLAGLGVSRSNHEVEEQLGMAARGELDLALVIMDADAPLIEDWVGRRGLQIASFATAHAVSRRLPHIKTGTIGAGNYDSVQGVPSTDRTVMKIETLLLGNGCAGRVATLDLLTLVANEHPELLRHNRDTPNTTGLPLAPAAQDYFTNGGPQLVDEYVPWLVDVMPPANWAYVVMAVSLLFNAMGAGHRFRLWRIDAARVKLESDLGHFFPPSTTLGDIQRTGPDEVKTTPETLEAIDHLIHGLEELAARSRRYSLSMLVPMGQEMAYRYQEGVIYETIAVLRDFLGRCRG
ncbi:MAG: TAXI family TRAP transporter solute-binding subunit, partial [Polyangiaceae bacterium]